MYMDYEIRQIPLSLKFEKKRVEEFLTHNGLRLEETDYYAGVFSCDDELLAAGGLQGNILKCLAVSDRLRDTGMGSRLISHLVNIATAHNSTVRCFTKPSNREIFESLGFRAIARAPQAMLMEMGSPGISGYISYLSGFRRPGRNGAVVMNANPFTKGHMYLIEQAAARVDNLYVIMVGEDRSLFTTDERYAMATEACRGISNVTVCHGSTYAISSLTFPTYFIKEVSEAAPTQITLDLDLFASHIAPALGVSIRFVGSEPKDELTGLYNKLMKSSLPPRGIEVLEIKRLIHGRESISASKVRSLIAGFRPDKAFDLVPETTWPYLIGQMAAEALRFELDLSPKPGLISPASNGSHSDMNYEIMKKSIEALRPYFIKLAEEGYREGPLSRQRISAIGLEAEKSMFKATHGVNTHKGALFALGLMTAVASHILYNNGHIEKLPLTFGLMNLAGGFPADTTTHGYEACRKYGIKGALDMAKDGYKNLFLIWQPYLSTHQNDPYAYHKLLLAIMSTLDDTNICHRGGYDVMNRVKDEAYELHEDFSMPGMIDFDRKMIERNLSPGGSADMLALTIFAEALMKIKQ